MIPKNFIFVPFLIFFCLMVVSPVSSLSLGESPCTGYDYSYGWTPYSYNPDEEPYGGCHIHPPVCQSDDTFTYNNNEHQLWFGLLDGPSLRNYYVVSCDGTAPTPTPTPSANCVSACGYTWTAGFTADDILLLMCMETAGRTPASSCDICGWQMQLMEEQFPCAVPPSPVPTYSPTPLPTVPPPPTVLPTLPPGPSPGPQAITIGDNDIHDVDFTIPTISTIAIPEFNRSSERKNITEVVGNITDPYLDSVDNFSIGVAFIIQHLLYLPNWVMASIYSTVQPIAQAFVDIIVVVADWGSVPLQLVRLALDNTPFGIQALLIYGVCLEMIIYLLRGDT